MNRDEIKVTIDSFFEAIEGKTIPADERILKLELALDRLAFAVHFAVYIFDDRTYPDAQVREYTAIREVVSKNFPTFGYYNVALDVSDNIAATSLAVGDAIDDICDIAGIWKWCCGVGRIQV